MKLNSYKGNQKKILTTREMLQAVMHEHGCKNQSDLARLLGVAPSFINMLFARKRNLGRAFGERLGYFQVEQMWRRK